MKKRFTAIIVRWFRKANDDIYYSVRIIRHKDGAICYSPFNYGYGDSYRQSALAAMLAAKWIPIKYPWMYETQNNYPIIWHVSNGLKRECVANGQCIGLST